METRSVAVWAVDSVVASVAVSVADLAVESDAVLVADSVRMSRLPVVASRSAAGWDQSVLPWVAVSAVVSVVESVVGSAVGLGDRSQQ